MFHRRLALQERHHTMQCNYLKILKMIFMNNRITKPPEGVIHNPRGQLRGGGTQMTIL